MRYSIIQTVISWRCIIAVIILLLTGSCDIFSSNSDQENIENSGEWSEPMILYVDPDTVDIGPFDGIGSFKMDVHEGTIRSVIDRGRFIDDRFLDFREIIFLEMEPGGEPELRQRISGTVPAEQPTIVRNHASTFNLLWADRRQDPDFEHWEIPSRSQLTNFSTNVVYSRYNGSFFEPPVSIYEGNLSTFGVGDIGFPLQLIEAEDRRLHTVFKADSMARTTNTMGDSVTAFVPRLVYINRSPAGEWNKPRFLSIDYKGNPGSLSGGNPVIAAPSANRLVVAFLSSVGGVNDVLTITSDDGGVTWSEAKLIFSSGRERSSFLTMRKAMDGQLHLVWARVIDDGSLPEEMWHSYSEDEGRTWSQPSSFFTLVSPTFTPEGSPEPTETILSNYDIVVDENSRVHWAGIEVFFEDSLQNKIHYTSWDPGTKTWEEPSMLEFASDPVELDLAFDGTTQKLYMFWEELEEEIIFYSVK